MLPISIAASIQPSSLKITIMYITIAKHFPMVMRIHRPLTTKRAEYS